MQDFGIKLIGQTNRVGEAVGQSKIDRGQTCRAGVSEIAHLHRGRLSGENQQAIEARMPGEINQNVDGISANPLGCLLVAQWGDLLPVIGG